MQEFEMEMDGPPKTVIAPLPELDSRLRADSNPYAMMEPSDNRKKTVQIKKNNQLLKKLM